MQWTIVMILCNYSSDHHSLCLISKFPEKSRKRPWFCLFFVFPSPHHTVQLHRWFKRSIWSCILLVGAWWCHPAGGQNHTNSPFPQIKQANIKIHIMPPPHAVALSPYFVNEINQLKRNELPCPSRATFLQKCARNSKFRFLTGMVVLLYNFMPGISR